MECGVKRFYLTGNYKVNRLIASFSFFSIFQIAGRCSRKAAALPSLCAQRQKPFVRPANGKEPLREASWQALGGAECPIAHEADLGDKLRRFRPPQASRCVCKFSL